MLSFPLPDLAFFFPLPGCGWGSVLCLLLLGGGLGFMGGLFGIGGGIIAIPVLVLGFGLEQGTAQGTALVMMVPNLLLAWWRYHRHHHNCALSTPKRFSAASLSLIATVTTAVTACVAQSLSQSWLLLLFTMFLLWIGGRPLLFSQAVEKSPSLPHGWIPAVGLLGGGAMGLLGIGGGLVATPALTRLFGLPQIQAQSLALALVTPSSAMALLAYAWNGRVDWYSGALLAVGGAGLVPAGVSLAHSWPEQRLRRAFSLMLTVTAGLMFIKWLQAF